MAKYQSDLYAGFERLRAFPELGYRHDDLTRSFAIGSHVALYQVSNGVVTILRVIHPRQLDRR